MFGAAAPAAGGGGFGAGFGGAAQPAAGGRAFPKHPNPLSSQLYAVCP